MEDKKEKFLLIDVHALVHRAYHAYPAHLSSDGVQTNAVYGFTSMLLEVIEKFEPGYLVACVDEGKPTERIKLFEGYKATRKPTDQELLDQLPIVHEVLEAFDVPIFGKEGFEADDLIGTVVNDPNINGGIEKIIVTGDKDIFQLVDDDTKVYLAGSAFSKSKLYNASEVKKKMGFGPEYVVDYKALRGDPSDNIPGVKGIGDKGAIGLIESFGHLETILENIDNIETKRVKSALEKGVEDAKLSYKLATILTDVEIEFDLEKAEFRGLDTDDVAAVLQKYNFKSLLKKLPGKLDVEVFQYKSFEGAQMGMFNQQLASSQKPLSGQAQVSSLKSQSNSYVLVDESNAGKLLEDLEAQEIFAFDTETDSLDYMNADLIGLSVSWKEGEAYYLSRELLDKYKKEFKAVFENLNVKKIGHNIKFDVHVLKNLGIEVCGVYFDTMIAAYLLKAGVGEYGLKSLALENFDIQMLEFKELLKLSDKKDDIRGVPIEKLSHYACADADITFRLFEKYKEELKAEERLQKLFYEVEMPIVEVLIGMERNGIELDAAKLKSFSKELDEKVARLKSQITDIVGHEFNLNSPKQLSEVLFGKLGLQSAKKTSTGAFSTNERVLRDIRSQHEIVDLILEYRELAKLRSTYTDALISQLNPDTRRIHSSFNQAVASTGRLSSSDPNLQNIPVASELGNKIREAFVASEGKLFVSLDYSQQELRILAAVSRDVLLLRAYQDNVDVHALTASKLFGKEVEEVTKEERSKGKTVNFSVIYGISAFGLADRLKIPQDMAQEFIDRYFETYQGVRNYFDELLKLAKTKGVIETKMGRKRNVSDINSSNFRVRRALERETINFPIQGGASDMMKLAMIKVARELEKSEWDGYKMVLQIHDELLFEIPQKEIGNPKSEIRKGRFVEMARECMLEANIYDVPMKVDVGIGKSWGEIE